MKLLNKLRGFASLRYLSLVALTLQTTVIITLYSYSRIVPEGKLQYLSTTVVVIAEILKLAFCCLVIFRESGSMKVTVRTLKSEVLMKPYESIKVIVPAGLYALQNNLAFYALTNLDPASYQIAYQLKILSTALFSVILLKKNISRLQWVSLFLLSAGVSMVQLSKESGAQSFNPGNDERNRLLGLLSIVVCCLSSGFSGVYFEKLVKLDPSQSIWIRNFQLAFFCCAISTIGMVYQNSREIMSNGIFQGYNTLTWILVLLQAFGGLIVATVVRHADNVLKGFATSISIIFSYFVSYLLFEDFRPSSNYYIGAFAVIMSTMMYNYGFDVKKKIN